LSLHLEQETGQFSLWNQPVVGGSTQGKFTKYLNHFSVSNIQILAKVRYYTFGEYLSHS
jgi:hypothetical protein